MDSATLDERNTKRIKAVQNSFGASGTQLSKPGRVLLTEGRLVKQCRRRLQPKAFFLFSDVLVYGSVIIKGRWHKKQRIIPLEDIQLEDLEDSDRMRNQWLIRTPAKSFYVSAASLEEKQTWIANIENCQASLLQGGPHRPPYALAVTWIPDKVSERCMRCFKRFSKTQRRHHCRKCGFLVCNSCSKHRGLILHIDPAEKQRLCKRCKHLNESGEGEMSTEVMSALR